MPELVVGSSIGVNAVLVLVSVDTGARHLAQERGFARSGLGGPGGAGFRFSRRASGPPAGCASGSRRPARASRLAAGYRWAFVSYLPRRDTEPLFRHSCVVTKSISSSTLASRVGSRSA
jgi:hypothetical protein